MEQLTLNYFK